MSEIDVNDINGTDNRSDLSPLPEPEKPRKSRKKLILAILIPLLVIALAITVFMLTGFGQAHFKLLMAELCDDRDEQSVIYTESMECYPTKTACTALFDYSISKNAYELISRYGLQLIADFELGDYAKERLTDTLALKLESGSVETVNAYRKLMIDYFELADEVEKLLSAYIPDVPKPDIPEGEYDEDFTVVLSFDRSLPKRYLYGCEFEITVEPEAMVINDKIRFTENGRYTIKASIINKLGLRSEIGEYTYTLAKPIPSAVKASVPSGYYHEPLVIELSQDKNLPIYYTLESYGEITKRSTLYTEPIELESGTLTIRTAAHSNDKNDLFGQEVTYVYNVMPYSSGLEDENTLITSRGTVNRTRSRFSVFTDEFRAEKLFSVGNNVDAFCEFENQLLYSSGVKLFKLDISTGIEAEFDVEAPTQLRLMLRVADGVFAISSDNRLFRMDARHNWTMLAEGVDAICRNKESTKVYICAGDELRVYDLGNLSMTKLADESEGLSDIAFAENKLYYITDDYNAKCYELSSGTLTTLASEWRDSGVGSKNSYLNGYSWVKDYTYEGVAVANGYLYIEEHNRGELTSTSTGKTSCSEDIRLRRYDITTDSYIDSINVLDNYIIGDGFVYDRYLRRVDQ